MAIDHDAALGERRHAYPRDLTDLVLRRWADVERACGAGHPPRPARERLEQALSASFQASLLRDERRPITFRIALASPAVYDAAAGPPTGLHRLVFDTPRPLDQHELRRLSPAAVFSRSFIGATLDADPEPRVWGLIHSGPNWLHQVIGGREARQSIPDVLTVSVTGPGRVLVEAGPVVIADLSSGSLIDDRLDVFHASWMDRVLSELGARQWSAHAQDAHGRTRPVDPSFGPTLARHALRRILGGIRSAQHGGMLLLVPRRSVPGLLGDGGLVRVKYRFVDEEPRHRFLTLSVAIMNELARAAASPNRAPPSWTEYAQSETQRIKELDTALFEVAHFVADLAEVDGAIVMSDDLDLIGFGGEITGRLSEVSHVARATDLEGLQRERVRTDRVGTRHRSAYRLCSQAHDVLAMVVSQDGGLCFVRWHDGIVTYWDQISAGPWETS